VTTPYRTPSAPLVPRRAPWWRRTCWRCNRWSAAMGLGCGGAIAPWCFVALTDWHPLTRGQAALAALCTALAALAGALVIRADGCPHRHPDGGPWR
jgi:hypothetical protein